MKILHTVQDYLPAHNGMQKVVQEISERLVEKGHEVTVVASGMILDDRTINGVLVRHFNCAGNYTTGMTGNIKEYQQFVMEQDYDILVNFAAQIWTTDAILPHLSQIRKPKVFVPTGFSGLYIPEYQNYFERMKAWLRQYDMNVFSSTGFQDIRFSQENAVPQNKIVTIYNGASEKEFDAPYDTSIRERCGIPEDSFLVLHVGSHDGRKGQLDAIRIFRKANLKNADLVFSGGVVSPRHYWECRLKSYMLTSEYNHIQIIPAVREDIVALYQSADVLLFPSQWECSALVLFEAMASKTPWLATDVGNSGQLSRMSNGGVVIPTDIVNGISHVNIKEGAYMLRYLYEHRDAAKRIGENGYEAWKKQFTWEKIAEQYENLYAKLVVQ